MRAFLIRRILQSLLTLWVIMSIGFVMFRMLPGDPSSVIADPYLGPEEVAHIKQRYGLDRSVPAQYLIYLQSLARLDLGNSFFYVRPVTRVMADAVPNTLVLVFASFLFAYGGAIPAGVLLSWKRGTKLELAGTFFSLVFRSAPRFWTGLMAVMIFSYFLDWLPHSGMRTPGYEADNLFEKYVSLDFLQHLILPTVVSGLYFLALPLFLIRNTMLEIMGEDYIEMARAKGLKEWVVMYRHTLRNALLPVVSAASVFIGVALGGQVLIEYIFSWPGLGRELVDSINRHDYPVAQGAFLLISTTVVAMNFLADLLYGWLDPRITYR
ncbi:MAG: ABC transporter permease [Deltaproteobacteria bacterium]|nr:ABC transporter permease [Deltaproteobacteria bacterium]MBI3075565.1 ABC transporter permease [Deltaproteobacteria bacterium]